MSTVPSTEPGGRLMSLDAPLWTGALAILWMLLAYLYRNKTFIRV